MGTNVIAVGEIPPLSEAAGLKAALVLSREEGFSCPKYLTIALAVGAVAGAMFAAGLPIVAVAFMAISAWYFWSAAIIVLNRAAEGSCLEKPISRLHAITMEIHAAITSTILFPFTCFDGYHCLRGNPKGKPILMVNGYLSFGSTWHYLRQKLVAAGLGPIYTMNVGSGRSIRTYARHVEEKVKKIKEETGRNDLILIGHSKGGLVSSYYATHLAAETNTEVTDVVTISSPLRGTLLAYLGVGYDAGEMRSGSEFHKELWKKIEGHSKTRFFHVGSTADMVVPPSSALPGKDPARHYLLKDMGHLGLVFSSRVADQIGTWLKA